PGNNSVNFIAGQHWSVQVNSKGIGLSTFNVSSNYGSSGRLQGINLLDANDRGIYSGNATHELIHQWAAYINSAVGLSSGGHYSPNSSVGSLVGGFRWTNNAQGRFVLDCPEGRNGAYHVAPLDKYLMGLISSNEIPVHFVGLPLSCGSVITSTSATVT